MKQRQSLKIKPDGHLEIGGVDAVSLAKKYQTPLYVMDEACIRQACEGFTQLLSRRYPNSLVCYASKAFCCKGIYAITNAMNLGADVVSAGELYTALSAGVDADKIYFHGNNKSVAELDMAVRENVHAVVVDSFFEIENLQIIAARQKKKQRVLVRVNPGVEAHTHQFVQTARVDSKFGFGIGDGMAMTAIRAILESPDLIFSGLHCHIGSQIFEVQPFEIAVEKMTDFMVKIKVEAHVHVAELNMGGGYGVTYTSEDKPLEPMRYAEAIVNKLDACLLKKKLTEPKLILEPGRSIVAEAGITLYTVGAIKEIPDIKKYVAVDGGMFENPRYALYQSKYDAVLANRANEPIQETVTIAGKCCESGDILIADIALPQAKSGDILAVMTTGAYNFSMASTYNRNPVPPVVLVNAGKSAYLVAPQSVEDIAARDKTPDWLKEDTIC